MSVAAPRAHAPTGQTVKARGGTPGATARQHARALKGRTRPETMIIIDVDGMFPAVRPV